MEKNLDNIDLSHINYIDILKQLFENEQKVLDEIQKTITFVEQQNKTQ